MAPGSPDRTPLSRATRHPSSWFCVSTDSPAQDPSSQVTVDKSLKLSGLVFFLSALWDPSKLCYPGSLGTKLRSSIWSIRWGNHHSDVGQQPPFAGFSLHAGHHANCPRDLLLLNPYSNLVKKIFAAPYYRREKWGSDWSKLTQGDHRAASSKIWTPVCLS